MPTSREIRQTSFKSMPETCPDIEKIFNTALEGVQRYTFEFRNVLEEWIERALEAEGTIEDLQKELNFAERRNEDLQEYIQELQKQIDDLKDR